MSTFKLLTLFLLLQVFGFDKWEGSQVVVLGGVLVLLAKYILKYMHLESCKVLLLRLGQLCWTRLLHLPVKDVLRRTRSTGAPSDSCIFDVHHQFAISTKNGSSDGW